MVYVILTGRAKEVLADRFHLIRRIVVDAGGDEEVELVDSLVPSRETGIRVELGPHALTLDRFQKMADALSLGLRSLGIKGVEIDIAALVVHPVATRA